MKVLIVDDEPLARTRLQRLLEQEETVQVVGEAEQGEQAIQMSNELRPDVVLMDIRMPLMDGLQAARHLAKADEPPAVIFCTAYDDYALEAFDTNAVGYLLKPVNRGKLSAALAKAQRLNRVQLSALEQVTANTSEVDTEAQRIHISAKSSRGIELIPIEQVRYFLADQKYVTVFHRQDDAIKEVIIDDPLKDLEEQLGDRFVRIHRNALVAVAHLQGLERNAEGARVRLDGVEQGPMVSRRHLGAIKQLLQQL